MIVLAEAIGAVTVGGETTEASAAVSIYALADEAGRAEIEIDDELPSVLFPVAGTRGRNQAVSWEVLIGGVAVPHKRILSIEVSEYLDQAATFQLSLLARGDWPSVVADPYGNPVTLGGPVPGGLAVEIAGYHVMPISGRFRFLLMANGVTHSSRRAGGLDIVSGMDASGRVDALTADLHLPPGHGLDAGAVCARIAEAAGFPTGAYVFRRDLGRMDKEVQLVNDAALSTVFEIAGARGYAPVCGRDGVLRLVRYDLDGTSPSRRWTIGRRDLVTDALAESGYAPPVHNIITAITADGTAQITKEECGQVTEPQRREVESDFEPGVYAFSQGSGGTLTASGLSPIGSSVQLTERITTTVERSCDEVLVEEVLREAFHRRQAARYTIDGSGAHPTTGVPDIETYRVVRLFDATAQQDDNAYGYLDSRDTFRRVGRQRIEHVFDANRLFTILTNDLGLPINDPIRVYPEPPEGYKVAEFETEWAWRNPRAALKFRDAGTINDPWDDIPFITSRMVNDRQEGVLNSWDEFMIVRRRLTVYSLLQVEDTYYITAQSTLTMELTARPGESYFYNGGFTSLDSSETLIPTVREVETYTAVDDTGDRHRRTKITSAPYASDPTNRTIIETEVIAGFLPEAKRRTDIAPDPNLFDTPEEAEAAALASRYEAQRIECEVTATALEVNRQRNLVEVSFPWAEDTDDLCAQAARMLREGSVGTLTFGLPQNLSIMPGDQVFFVDERNFLNLTAYVTRCTRRWTGTAVVVEVEAKVYTLTDAQIAITVGGG